MAFHSALKLQQSPLGAVLPGCWKLTPERAVTLHPDAPGMLRIAQGRVWATLDGPHQGPANDWGDVVLRSGEQLQLLPGQHLVVEVYGDAVNEPVYFSWEPVQQAQAADGLSASPWADPLARPLLHLGNPVLRLAGSLGRALVQVGALLEWLVPGRGRALSPMEFNQP